MSIKIELATDEAVAVLNALNYFANAIDADECHTLLGLEQTKVRSLHERLHDVQRRHDRDVK